MNCNRKKNICQHPLNNSYINIFPLFEADYVVSAIENFHVKTTVPLQVLYVTAAITESIQICLVAVLIKTDFSFQRSKIEVKKNTYTYIYIYIYIYINFKYFNIRF